jgi:hypothetical protein
VHDVSKAERRAIRELAGLAYERELAGELTKLRASFDAWVAGQMTPFELEQVIHQFHDGVSRRCAPGGGAPSGAPTVSRVVERFARRNGLHLGANRCVRSTLKRQ